MWSLRPAWKSGKGVIFEQMLEVAFFAQAMMAGYD
jgi:hypothetical protein